jgi:Protein of unknown function (DUF1810)
LTRKERETAPNFATPGGGLTGSLALSQDSPSDKGDQRQPDGKAPFLLTARPRFLQPRRNGMPPRALKFRSCLTLFREAASENSDRMLFTKALDQFYRGDPDERTLELLEPKI